ncbi:MAG: hypothetical protein J1E95_02730 [Muribaculaceae bacterium]|nr:hypothetical protein [Muribaculaceae bacterium]
MSLIRTIVASVVVTFCLMVMTIPTYGNENQWEQIETIGEGVKPISKQQDIEVFSAPSVIKVNVTRTLKIEIFTILGKLISSQELEAGNYEFRMNSHGVYIVKTAESTSKVAI